MLLDVRVLKMEACVFGPLECNAILLLYYAVFDKLKKSRESRKCCAFSRATCLNRLEEGEDLSLLHRTRVLETNEEDLHTGAAKRKKDASDDASSGKKRLKKAMIDSSEDAADDDLVDVVLDLQENGDFGFQITINKNLRAVETVIRLCGHA
ncbi:hypothetical protein HS088_TW04G01326 [Tripterygium wilfordii]|uniref:Uncharacterized protein n=1 Tax=Tripterygium wilfordii TaxID=458696 RepID=A0A7J7DSL6_TRIWF|nr:hypothetical protein HS088_TW04G01326 [Tripterygium wilfordii]